MTTDLAIQTNLPALAKSVTAARNTEIINRMAPDEVVQFVDSLCLNIISRIGQQNIGADIIRATKVDIQDALKGKYKAWNSGEIMLAVNMGARGELGVRESHFCSRTVFQWLNAYDETIRRQANKLIEKHSHTEENPMELNNDQKLDHLERFYQSWMSLQEGQILGGYSTSFGYAWDLELLRFNKDRRKEFADRAVEKMTAEFRAMKASKNTFQAGADGLRMLSHVDTTKRDIHGQVKAEAAKIALIEWFEHLKEMESSPSKQMQDLP